MRARATCVWTASRWYPKNDPSLLLINSGMAPMKKWFLAQEEPPRHRVTTCQKCIRTPDIERVGITARHGTFFEMLGNFSFQDYFKEEVIPWAWEFLTSDEWMAIPKDKLHISVYEEDDEAYDIWTKKVGIAPGSHGPPGQGRQLLGARLRPVRPLLRDLL